MSDRDMRQYYLPPRPGAPSSKPIPVLTDDSPMPYGKHKGTPMKKVPPGYLLYIWDVDDGMWMDGPHLYPSVKAVRAYIVKSFSALELECPDFNVKHHPDKMDKPKPPRKVEGPTFK